MHACVLACLPVGRWVCVSMWEGVHVKRVRGNKNRFIFFKSQEATFVLMPMDDEAHTHACTRARTHARICDSSMTSIAASPSP